MCGIFGTFNPRGIDPAMLVGAVTKLRHRGPDDEGYLFVNTARGGTLACGGEDSDTRLDLPPAAGIQGAAYNLALGFRRLAILDLSIAGHQPMPSTDRRCWIVF